MARWLRITLIVVVLLLVAAAAPIIGSSATAIRRARFPKYNFDIAAVRAKADELPGGKASDIRVESVASFSFPAVASVGGDGFNTVADGGVLVPGAAADRHDRHRFRFRARAGRGHAVADL